MKQQTNLLIVEDNTIAALDMKHSLEKENFFITSIEKTLKGVKESIKKNIPDIAVVDIHLGENENGIAIGEYLDSIDIPIIYSTSYSDIETIQKALQTDPVCYLVKPINLDELKSNIYLGIYKNSRYKLNSSIQQINIHYRFDTRLNKLFYYEDPINLSKMELKLIKILLNSEEKVVLFQDMEYLLWKNKPIKNSALRTIIYRLRKKLPVNLIETIPNIGFSFVQT